MQIGTVFIEPTAALAPMAGLTDPAFRALCRSFGAAYTVSEMVSVKGIQYNGRKTFELLRVAEAERPVAIQLFGCEPAVVAAAAITAERFEPDVLDINMGCPTPKITGGGSGSALMRDPKLCGEIVRATVAATRLPVTVKLRTGWDDAHINCVEIAKIVEDAGAAAVAVHGRTREQMYTGRADRLQIAAVKRAVSIPVIGNGDIVSAEDALALYAETGCDLVMIGRGALGNPWLFAEVAAARRGGPVPPPPALSERMAVMRRHIEALVACKGEYIGMREARAHIPYYLRGMHDAARLRSGACRLSRLDELPAFIESVLAAQEG